MSHPIEINTAQHNAADPTMTAARAQSGQRSSVGG
jgi:hypothetical protein